MFDVGVREMSGGLVLDLSGDFGREGGEAVMRAAQARSVLPGRLVLNFSGVGTMNSAGLGGVIWVVRAVTRAGGQVRVYGLTDHLRRILHVMGLVEYVTICADERSALA